MRLSTALLLAPLLACGAPSVPHFIDPDGLDLGPVVSASSRATYYAPVGTTVEWGSGVAVVYREPNCRGAAWSSGGPPLPGAVPLLDGQLWRVAPELEPVGAVASALVLDPAGRPACRELPHTAPDRHRLEPTGEPGRLYRDDELRVELR